MEYQKNSIQKLWNREHLRKSEAEIQIQTGMKNTRLVATVGHDSAATVAAISQFWRK